MRVSSRRIPDLEGLDELAELGAPVVAQASPVAVVSAVPVVAWA